jgi:hypothetical protein
VARDPGIVEALVEPELGELGDRALQVIVESVGSIPVLSDSLLKKVFRYRPNNLKLIDIVIRSAVADYVRSGKSEAILEIVLEQKAFAEWLLAKSWSLAGLIRGAISDSESCCRGWHVIYKLPDVAYRRDIVVGVIDSLLGVTAEYCSLAVVQTWVKIIRRARKFDSDRKFGVDLCGQAIRFAFENPRLPVSELAVEAFLPLYESVTKVKYVPATVASVFSLWNWDKGSELREALVDKSLTGSWPPGDVALAVHEFGLLRKILKRMSRKRNGQSYARRMYSDLASKSDDQSRSLANSLSGLLRSPDYDEEWD